jgi:hypothetical protein
MSEEQKIEFASAEPTEMEEEIAAAIPVRRSKRRNCMLIPGSSDPMVAKLFSEAMMKEVFGSKVEADEENPENVLLI